MTTVTTVTTVAATYVDRVPRDHARLLPRALGMTGLALLLLAFTAGGMAPMLLGLVIAGLLARAIWKHPAWATVAMVALLPVDRFVVLLVFHFSGSPSATLAAQAWKDLLITVLLLRAVHELLTGTRPKLRYLDLLVVTFLAIATLYLIYPGAPGLNLTVFNRILGYRADAVFLFAYIVGRTIPFERRQLRWLLLAVVPGTLVVAAVAAAQIAAPGWWIRFFNNLDFQQFAGGLGGTEVIRSRGIGGVQLTRASSLLLGDLALGFFCVFAASVATALYFTARRRSSTVITGIVVCAAVTTTVLSVTRSAVLAAALVILTAGVLTRRFGRAVLLAAVLTLGGLVALATNLLPPEQVTELADPQEGSFQAHIRAIETGLDVLRDHPMGRGLGTAGTIGQRFVPHDALTSENWFLQEATELGAVAGVLFLAITIIGAVLAVGAAIRLHDMDLKRIALAASVGSAGFFLLANVLHAWEVPVLSMSFWLMVGIAASGREREEALA